MRRTVGPLGVAAEGVLDIDVVDLVSAAHVDDEIGGVVGGVEDGTVAEVAGCDGDGIGFGVAVALAVPVAELEMR